MRAIGAAIGLVYLGSFAAIAQLSPDVREYVKFDAPAIAITHARVIDGTGAAARNDETILSCDGKIESVGGPSIPPDAKVIDATGRSVIPGLIDMHGHMFYSAGNVYHQNGSLVMAASR
jgi:imidazolonepropionase-like amidohydrolase